MRLEGFDELMSAAMNRRQAKEKLHHGAVPRRFHSTANASEGRPWRPDA
jgi:hypothetical protein